MATSPNRKRVWRHFFILYLKFNELKARSRASCLPTPPPTSNMEECSVLSAKRRKIGMDDEVMNLEVPFRLLAVAHTVILQE